MIGQTLGHYRIVREIGAGGMGVVYEAEDTTLGRQVALKILPPELAKDDDRRQRFAREARAVAALNHPNIVTVHSVEESGGIHFITMELVKGKTLAELLPRQGFALGRFFEITIPLVDAVSAAHQQGIAHRDLKPANVMIGDDGRIKVLDFGLAKGMDGEPGRVGEVPTQSASRAGHTVGTPAYMSPEQAQGERVDTRSDIFSLGIVFYEMLTGRRPFEGANAASVISAILDQLVARVEDFGRRANPGAREIVIQQDVDAIRRKWNIEDLDVLNPAYLETLRAKKQKVFDAETKAIDAEIAPQLEPLPAAIGQQFAEARCLRLESERVDAAANPNGFVTARLVDEFAGERAERFLSKNKTNPQAILDRYNQSAGADRGDLHFVRLVEQAYGQTDESPSDESGYNTFPLTAAVRHRQDARIPAALRAAHDKLNAAERTYRMARAEAFPDAGTMNAAVGGLLRRAK